MVLVEDQSPGILIEGNSVARFESEEMSGFRGQKR